jgi:uncharacterized protein
MNRLSPAYEIKRATVQADGTFTGYASTFDGPADAYGDTIARGAFTKSLAKHKAEGTAPAMLWQHHPDEPIGTWLSFTEDAAGLAVTGKLATGTTKGAEAHDLLKQKAITGLSIGFVIPKGGATNGPKGRRLTELELWEVSLVTFPANTAARVIEVRSIKEFEAHLRDSGFPKAAALKLASGGWPALDGRDAHQMDGLHELTALVNRRSAELDRILRTKAHGH